MTFQEILDQTLERWRSAFGQDEELQANASKKHFREWRKKGWL